MLKVIFNAIMAKFRYNVQNFKVAKDVNVSLIFDKKARSTRISVTCFRNNETRTVSRVLEKEDNFTPIYLFLKKNSERASTTIDSQLISKIAMIASQINANGRPSVLLAA